MASDLLFRTLETALAGSCEPKLKVNVFRWLCLSYFQNELLQERVRVLSRSLSEAQQQLGDLREEMNEGTYHWRLANWQRCVQSTREPKSEQAKQYMIEEEVLRRAYRASKRKKDEQQTARRLAESEIKRKRSGTPTSYCKSIDWTQPHPIQDYVDAFGEKSIHAKRVRAWIRNLTGGSKHPGNKPLHYSFETGMAIFREAVTKWIQKERRFGFLFSTTTFQAVQPSALTPNGLLIRAVLSELWKGIAPEQSPSIMSDFWRDRPQKGPYPIPPELMSAAICTKTGWLSLRSTLLKNQAAARGGRLV